MSADQRSSMEKELRERIAQLELENKTVKSKLSRMEMRSLSAEPLCRQDPNCKHEFRIELPREDNACLSYAHTVGGVDFCVGLNRQHERGSDTKFFATLTVRNQNAGAQNFVLTTMEVGQKNVEPTSAFSISEITAQSGHFTSLVGPISQHFVICNADEDEETYARCAVTIYARVTIAVQSIEGRGLDEDDDKIVVVNREEFHVSARYLSTWSRYFQVYFRSNMKEKKEGRYPISDEDISAADFRELLAVILPSDKPITKSNFMKLLTMAERFEMPELTRRVECFLIDFDRNEMNRANVFRIATDVFQLKLVQSALVHRWDTLQLLQRELVQTPEYDKLSTETKVFINEKFVQAYIDKEGGERGFGAIAVSDEESGSSRRRRGRANSNRVVPPQFRTSNLPVNDNDW